MPATPLLADQAVRLNTAFAQLTSGNLADAMAEAKRLVSEAPNAPDAHQLLAMCLADAGDPSASDSAFRRAIELAPDSALLFVNYAAMLRKFGRLEVALEVLQHAVQIAPKHGGAWIDLGLAALNLGRFPEACRALSRAIELQPNSVLAWHALGNARRAFGELEAAAAAFAKVTELNPAFAGGWANLGAVKRLLGHSRDALVCFDRAKQCGFDSPELINIRIGTLRDEQRTEEAAALARELVKTHPDFVPGYITLAHILWEDGITDDDDAAVRMLRDATRQRPANRELRAECVRFLLASGNAQEALDEVRALRGDGDHPHLALLEANALEALGDSSRAAALYSALSPVLAASDTTFLIAYTRHLLRTGEWQKASEQAMAATRLDPYHQEAWAYLSTAWRLLRDEREYWLCDYENLITLVDVTPPAEFSSTETFLDALSSVLIPLHVTKREPVQQSLRGGSQTAGRLFGRPEPVLDATHTALVHTIEQWIRTIAHDPTHPCRSRTGRSVRFTGSWSVRLRSSGKHVNHFHPEGWLSSAFYVALPPSVTAARDASSTAGCIQFGQPPVDLGLDLPPRRVIRPRLGALALFPSYMWHGTVPFDDVEPRMTIAFDMLPTRG